MTQEKTLPTAILHFV